MLQEVSVSSRSLTWSWGSSVGIVTRLRAGGLRYFSFPSRGESFFRTQNTQAKSAAYLASHSVGVRISFPGGKVAST